MLYKMNQVWAAILNLDPYLIISKYFPDAHMEGHHIVFLCPFHKDEDPSLKYTPEKNIWKCFACGASGSGIVSLMMRYFDEVMNLPMPEDKKEKANYTVLRIACDFELITEKQFEAFSKQKYITKDPALSHSEEPVYYNVTQISADADVMNNVYRAMAEVCGLSKKHRKHLLQERMLQESDLSSYFSFPERKKMFGKGIDLHKAIIDCLVNKLSLIRYNKEFKALTEQEKKPIYENGFIKKVKKQFLYVPGFYFRPVTQEEIEKAKKVFSDETIKKQMEESLCFYDSDNGRIYGFYEYMSYDGIGILNTDSRAWVCGIDIRKDKVTKKESRYVRFSSEFAHGKQNYIGGSSSGSPGGVIYPKEPGSCQLFVTEGRFKAEKIAETGNIAIYITGVATWKNAMPLIDEVREWRTKIFIAFDSDLMGNKAVHQQLRSLADALMERNMDVRMIVWRMSHGKGFDDLLISSGIQNYKRFVKSITFRQFEAIYTNCLENAGDAVQKDVLQSEIETALNLN